MVSSAKAKFLQGSVLNVVRILLSTIVSLLLPRFLVHRLTTAEYSAWVLILQLSAYVTYLDFGMQTAVGKFIAEYDASGDRDAARQTISSAFFVLALGSLLGLIVTAVLTYWVPQIFHQMPPDLFYEVRVGLLCIGVSVCFMLPFSVFMSAFTGLQQYTYPTIFSAVSRAVTAISLVLVVFLHGSLLQMAWSIAIVNVVTALAQVYGWKRYASERVPFSLFYFDANRLRQLAEYCGILFIWTLTTVLISGLDTTIIGHFDYSNTGYYAVAGSATNFMLVLTSAILSPLLPAISFLQASRTPGQLGDLLIRSTRFGVVALLAFGLPLLVGGYPLLTAWLGSSYAAKSVLFLDALVLGNLLRQIGLPYTLFIVATGKQRFATVSPVAESIVNIILSLVLARSFGALGVALGTLIAAFVGLAAHITISMHYTQSTIAIQRWRLIRHGVLRPALAIVPTVLLLPFWRRYSLWPARPDLLAAWFIATAAILWWVGLTSTERLQVMQEVQGRLGRLAS